jgi:hypothetical protein
VILRVYVSGMEGIGMLGWRSRQSWGSENGDWL